MVRVIPVGTELQPRQASDPVVKIVGIESTRYMLAPVEFGSPFAMNYDEITAAYDCAGHVVHIEPFDETAAWRRLSKEKFHGKMAAGRRQRKRQEAEPSPEQVFAAQAAEAAADGAG